jgi:transposase
MLSNQIFTVALGINDPWFIQDITLDNETKRLDIHVSFRRGAMFESVNKGFPGNHNVYDSKQKTWRHLNFFEYECYLHCRAPRIDLGDGKTELVKPPWAGLVDGFTLLFEAFVVQLSMVAPVKSVSELTHVTDTRIWRLLEKYVIGARAQEDYSDVVKIGIDETSLKKNHNYITLFVDLEEKRTVFVTDGKDHETVERFAADLRRHGGEEEQIEFVSADMSPAFIKGVNENLPKAEITFDKFHVIKGINDAVNQVRIEEVCSQPVLRKKRFVVLKNNANLTDNQRIALEEIKLSSLNLKTYRALRIREAFQEIYQIAETKDDFEKLLRKWYYWATHSRLEPIKKVARTIKSHWDGIVAWIKSRVNNGILEGLNSVLQATKAKARGYRNVRYFRTTAYLLTGKFDYSKINKHYVPVK